MDVRAVLARYDEQVRRRPVPDPPSGRVEAVGGVVRVVDPGGGWQGVSASDLDERTADAAIAAQLAAFAATGLPWEWKHHSYDAPSDLPARLVAAGLVPEPTETLLVVDLTGPAAPDLAASPPAGTALVPVVDAAGVAALVALHEEVFGGDHAAVGEELLRELDRPGAPGAPRAVGDGPAVRAVLAVEGRRVVGAGRVELHRGGDVASLWGGGVVADRRGRGVFRALVAHRAATARDHGALHLHVDATAMSRPVLERLGFVALATTTPFTHPGRPTTEPPGR